MELEAHPAQPFLVQLKEWKYREVKGLVQGHSQCQSLRSLSSVHSLSHAQLFVTPWTTAHQAVYHQLLELAQTHVHRVSDAKKPSSLILPVVAFCCFSLS